MAKLAPFNITMINPDEYVKRKQCLPVSSNAMYESSTERFHPDGLYSEVIFGQLGSRERLIRRGFMYLRTTLISPHLYRQIMTLKNYYQDIAAGRQYAYYDPKIKDFVRTSRDDPNSDTGYEFFISHVDKIDFAKSNSAQRNDKIALVQKYKDCLFITKFIILPAALRDVRINNGRPESEKINKLYLNLLAFTKSLPENGASDSIFDPIRYQMQNKLQEIYDYIRNMIDDKHGFAQGKYAARDIVYGSRNVITSPLLTQTLSPTAPNVFSIDEALIPLFEGLKALVPVIVNVFTTKLLASIFNGEQTKVIPLINSKTLRREYVEVDDQTIARFTSADGINGLINDFRDNTMHFQPITIKPAKSEINEKAVDEYYLFMMYDDGDTIYQFRDIEEFKQAYAKTNRYRDDNPYTHVLDSYPPENYLIEGTGALRAHGMDINPQDLDVIMKPEMYQHFLEVAKQQKVKPDEFGDYEIMVDDVEIHMKNNCYQIKTDADWEKLKSEQGIQIGQHYYIKPEIMAARYKAIEAKGGRLKDKRKLEFYRTIVFDESKVRPMTYMELMYIACYTAMQGKHFTVTRYPVLNMYNIYPVKGHLISTEPSRVVKYVYSLNPEISVTLNSYPVMGAVSKQSLSVHPATLGHLDADHDGDTMSLLPILSEDANKEVDDFMQSTASILDESGNLIWGLTAGGQSVVVPVTLFFCTYRPIEQK